MSETTSGAGRTATVLGASGGTGAALVAELAGRGYAVRAVSRSGKVPGADRLGVEVLKLDVTDPVQVETAAKGADVVFHAAAPAYHRWTQEFPAMTDAIARGAAAAGAKLVLADNLYMYGPHEGPLTEDLPAAPITRKGRVRAAMAGKLLADHRAGRLEVALARSSNYYGPHATNSTAGDRIFGHALAGKKAQIIGALDQPHTWSYLPDMARAMVTLSEHDTAYGRAWHLPNNPPITSRDFIELVFAAVGTAPKFGSVPRPMLYALGLVNPTVRELPEMLFEFEKPFVVDDSAFRAAFGPFENTPHADAIRATTDWYRAQQ